MNVETRVEVRRDDGLDAATLDRLTGLFDAEYRREHGAWTRDAPYGYAPAEVRVLAWSAGELVGHVGFQRRVVDVGGLDVVVGGTGGVLVAPGARGLGLGARLLGTARLAMRAEGLDFGLLGCREEVVPFYVAAGWRRITVRERSLSRRTGLPEIAEGAPTLIVGALRDAETWPMGDVDLRGRPW